MSKWIKYNLDDLAWYHNGMAFKPNDWKEDGVKIIRIEQLNNPTGYYDHYQGEIPEVNQIRNGDLIFSWSATLKVGIWKHGYGVLNQHLFKVIPRENIDKHFLYYLLDNNMEKLGESSHGLTMKHIKRGELKKYYVEIPSKSEQQRIAHILSTCDTVIEKTEAAIEKYRAIKQGMLQDLFTRGIDINTGKLRPRYEDAPELYKESMLGWIPKEWEVDELGTIGDFKNGVNKDKSLFGYGTLFVNIGDAYQDYLDCYTLNRVKINESELQDYKLQNGDIVFVRSSVKPSGIGYTTIFKGHNEPVVFSGFMIRYRLSDKQDYIPDFYNSYFRYEKFRQQLIAFSTVSANTNINQVALNKLYAIHPNMDEQNLIIERITTLDNKLHAEQAYLQKMQQIKRGLMEDLLTGKRRVAVNKKETVSHE